jgi:hypothetical protein
LFTTVKNKIFAPLKIKIMGAIRDFIDKNYLHFNSAALVDASKGYEQHLLEGGKMMITLGRGYVYSRTGHFFG